MGGAVARSVARAMDEADAPGDRTDAAGDDANDDANDEASDEVLALRAGGGERAAFEALVERHFDAIHAACWRISGEGADDLAQDVCERLPRALRSYRGEARFSTWLHRLVVNASRDAWRRRQSYGRALDGWAEVEPMRMAEAGQARERASWLRGAMRGLSQPLRETVALVLGEDMTHADAADVLGVGEGTVSWRMSEVRRVLRARAREDGEIAGETRGKAARKGKAKGR